MHERDQSITADISRKTFAQYNAAMVKNTNKMFEGMRNGMENKTESNIMPSYKSMVQSL